MSADPSGPRQPWPGYRSVRSTEPTVSSSLYALHRPAPAPAPAPGPDPGPDPAPRSVRLAALPASLETLELAQVSGLNAALLGLRAREKAQLGGLNDRLAAYAEQARRLGQRNRALRAQLEALRQRERAAPGPQRLWQRELRSLRGRCAAEAGEARRLAAGREQLREARERLRGRCAAEAQRRLRAEETLRALREEAGRAALARGAAEGRVGSLRAELAFLRRLCGAESAALAAQLRAARRAAPGGPAAAAAAAPQAELAGALREIRAQYEALAGRNRQAARDWYRARFASAAELGGRQSEAVRAMRAETAGYRRLLRARAAELGALRGLVDGLNRQLESAEERRSAELATCQGRVAELEQEIGAAKQEMARHLGGYQDLLSVKMALDMEIAAYRKLLEGEETRLRCSPAL